jgi:ABC-type sugar transport system ATPase subunit
VTEPYLTAAGISKAFRGTQALRDFGLDLYPGEVHALVGQNGSGKSTFIKILSGYHAPDSGTLRIRGEAMGLPLSPRRAAASGLRFVHQNLGLAPMFTVLETIRLNDWHPALGRVNWRRERAAVADLLAELRIDLSPDRLVAELTPSQRAVVAIARALQGLRGGNVAIVLDEPTASLGRADSERLFETLGAMQAQGHAVLFISHRLDEVLSIADRVTVLRDGRRVMTEPVSQVSESDLVSAILGRDLGALYPEPPSEVGDAFLRVEGMTGATAVDVTLTVARGEIVGVTGLGGMGHDEIPALIYGAARTRSGRVVVDGRPIEPLNPRTSRAAGFAYMPADRERAGGVMRATLAENVTMGTVGAFFRHGFIDRRAEAATVQELLQQFQVRPPEPTMTLAALSGGNQQKVLLAKWLQSPPSVLLLHEPTQGIDVGSRQQVFQIIKRTAEAGAAVLMSSAEYSDLAHICNRVLVMRSGRLVTQLSGDDLSEARLIHACYTTGGPVP